MKFRQVLKQAYTPDLVRLEYPLGDPPGSDVATAAATVADQREKHLRTKDEKRFDKKVDFMYHVQEDEYAVGENSGAETEQHLRHAKENVIHLAKCARSLSMALKKRVPDCREGIVPFHFRTKSSILPAIRGPGRDLHHAPVPTQKHRERNPALYVDYDNIMAQYHAAEAMRAAEREAMRASSSKAPRSAPVVLPAKPSAPVLPAKPSAPVLPAKPSAPVLTVKPSAPVLPAKPSAPVHLPAKHSREQSPSSSRPLPSFMQQKQNVPRHTTSV
ncbi:hypothetical protein HDU88_000431 [Geranomyces variabilis]|nr:hypothetical protein HDU88_000431 [Geranomyces variabilis]